MALSDTAKLVASLELQDKFSRPADQAGRKLDMLSTKTSTLGRVAGETRRGIGNLASSLGTLATIGIGAAVAGLAFSVRQASNLEESLSKVTVVFGEASAAVIAWSEDSASAFGQSQQQALEAAGTYGNLFKAFGLGNEDAQEMSTTLTELAADLASFNNTSVDDALLALRSGLSGETEPLKRFGVSLTEARLKAEALRLGIIRNTKTALTPAQKAQAAYALILQDTALAQGDFARTSGGLANQQRILRANLTNTAATIGTALLPKITELAVKFNTLITENQDVITQAAASFPAIFDSVERVVMALPWDSIGNALELMGTGSKALLDAFVSMPPWVQTAVLTGWGLNKLTGGALTGIVGALASGLIKGVLGINAGVVNINAATVTGAGALPGVLTGAAGAAGAAGAGAAAVTATALAAGVIGIVGTLLGGVSVLEGLKGARTEDEAREAAAPLLTGFPGLIAQAIEDVLGDPLGDIADALESQGEGTLAGAQVDKKNAAANAVTSGRVIRGVNEVEDVLRGSSTRQAAADREAVVAARNSAVSQLQQQSIANQRLLSIANKDFRPRVNVTTTVISNVTISELQRKITSQQIAVGTGPLEFEN